MIISNKRGDISMYLVFLSALFLTILSLSLMYGFGNDGLAFRSDSQEIMNNIDFAYHYTIEEAKIIGQKSIVCKKEVINAKSLTEDNGANKIIKEKVKKNCGDSDELKEIFKFLAVKQNLGISYVQDFFDKIEKGQFVFKEDSNGYELIFEGSNQISTKVSVGKSDLKNTIVRKFDINLKFDINGVPQ